jgi:hypothetical protein
MASTTQNSKRGEPSEYGRVMKLRELTEKREKKTSCDK